jgi:hypothetical protein
MYCAAQEIDARGSFQVTEGRQVNRATFPPRPILGMAGETRRDRVLSSTVVGKDGHLLTTRDTGGIKSPGRRADLIVAGDSLRRVPDALQSIR